MRPEPASLVVALADALEIAPSELTTPSVPVVTDGDTDTVVKGSGAR